jgi:hypothetical protein
MAHSGFGFAGEAVMICKQLGLTGHDLRLIFE